MAFGKGEGNEDSCYHAWLHTVLLDTLHENQMGGLLRMSRPRETAQKDSRPLSYILLHIQYADQEYRCILDHPQSSRPRCYPVLPIQSET